MMHPILSNGILYSIIYLLPPKDLLKVRHVCLKFREVADSIHPVLKHTVYFYRNERQKAEVSTEALKQLLEHVWELPRDEDFSKILTVVRRILVGEVKTERQLVILCNLLDKAITEYFIQESEEFWTFVQNEKSDLQGLIDKSLRSRVQCLVQIKQQDIELSKIPMSLRTEDICLAAVKKNGHAILSVPEPHKTRMMCIAAVKQNLNVGNVVGSYLTEEDTRNVLESLWNQHR